MLLTILIDIVMVATLVVVNARRGLEATLPYFAFFLILVPEDANIMLPGLFGLNPQRIVIITILVMFLLSNRSPASALPLKYLMGLHILWCLVSTANSIVPVMSVKKLIAEVVEYYLIYFILYRTISSVGTIHKILAGFLAAVGVGSVFGAVEAYTGWQVASLFPPDLSRFSVYGDELDRGFRVQSTFPHAILWGGALVLAIPVALYLLTLTKTVLGKTAIWSVIFLMFLNLYKTESRGPWLAALLSFAVGFVLLGNRIRKYMLVIVLLCVTVLVLRPGVWESIKTIYSNTYDTNTVTGASYEYRYALLEVSREALAKSPARSAWGYGMESFFDLHLRGPFLDQQDHAFISCDSAWIEFMIETGYVGLFLIGALLLKAAWKTLAFAVKVAAEERRLACLLLVNLLAYYFMMLSVAMYAWGQNGYVLWITIAMAMAYFSLTRQEKARKLSTVSAQPVPDEAEVEPVFGAVS